MGDGIKTIFSTFFGAIYSLFGMGIALITNNESMSLVLPGVLYHSLRFIAVFFEQTTFLSWLAVLFPTLVFEFGAIDMPMWKNALDLSIIFLASVLLIIYGYNKRKRFIKTESEGISI